jgi:hypothetical protein
MIGFKAFMPASVAAGMRVCVPRVKRFALGVLSAMLSFLRLSRDDSEKRSVALRTPSLQTHRQSFIRRESRTSVVMQFVQFFQVYDRGDLQEIEIIFAGITKIVDVTIESGTPAALARARARQLG